MPTDISEAGLETLMVADMRAAGWLAGDPKDFDRAWALDLAKLRAFLEATQPKLATAVDIANDTPTRRAFLARLSGELNKSGVIDVLRKGVDHGPHHLNLFFGTPSEGNARAQQLFAENRFSVTRQLRYSQDETRRALDLSLFVNGLPISTFELKNNVTKQTVDDAVEQYRRDRDPREQLFGLAGAWFISRWMKTK